MSGCIWFTFSSLFIGIWAAAFQSNRQTCFVFAFSSLFIGIWAAAMETITDAKLNEIFQFPLHRDLGCSIGRGGVGYGRGYFQFPLHRDLGCSDSVNPCVRDGSQGFQFPLHRDLGCSTSNMNVARYDLAFQFPLHRDLGCSSTGIAYILMKTTFQFPLHRDLGCSIEEKAENKQNAKLSVPSS